MTPGQAALLLGVLMGFAAMAGASPGKLLIANRGASDFRIVVSRQASPSEKHAAAELQHLLQEISGVELPVTSDDGPMSPHEILVGDSDHLKQLGERIDWQGLGREGFVIRTSGGHLILAGGRLRGSMYAVYTFLEDVLGCRWFTAKVSRIPKMARIEVGPLNARQVPMLEYREPFWVEAFDADWAARNKMNSSASRLDEERGGKIVYKGFVHTFYPLLPPDRYFKDHPEYYSEINGRRTADHAQLCLTNPEVVRLVAEQVKQWLKESPGADIVSVSQNDWGGWCECPKCKALDEREGSHAGTLINFVNQVAEVVEKDFPDVAIDTLAYQYTRKPPKTIRPRPNVIVRLCSIECCFSHPLATCPENRTFKQDLEGWSKVADRLYVWDYTTNFAHYIQPHPNLRVLKPNIQLYVKNHVRGIFEQGNYNGGGGGEMAELRAYMLAKLLWNPDYDDHKAMREFVQAVYGKAAPAIARYIKLMHDKVQKDNIHCSIWYPPTHPHLSPPMIGRAKRLFDEAERLAGSPEVRERVRLARLPIQYVELEQMRPKYRVRAGTYLPERMREREALAKRFFDVAGRNGITQISEGRTLSWYKERAESWTRGWPCVRLENRRVRVDVVPALGGRIISIYDKKARREVLLPPQPDDRDYPRSGGYEEYSESLYRSPGWREEYEYRVEAPGRRVALWANLDNGLKIERTLELPGDGAALAVRTKLSNVSGEEKVARIRAHPMFQLGRTSDVVVSLEDVSGRRRKLAMRPRARGKEWEITLKGAGVPDGQWEAFDRKMGLGVRQTFSVEQVERCLLNWRADRQRFNLELFSPEKTLAPGDSIELAHTLELVSAE